jgi:hypothetical protein
MLNIINIIKATIICAIVNAIDVFYSSTSAFVKMLEAEGQHMGRIEAFLNTAKITDNFWPHMIKSWSYGFAITLIACLILLLLVKNPPNNSLNRIGAEDAPPG